jgi:lipoate-protein ligase A
MALDEALMSHARETGEWVFRVYSWSQPTLSLGRNQRARGGYDLEAMAERGVDIVRRPTGGRAILHHREVTYSVTAPLSDAGDLSESYARINRLLVTALRALGVDAVVAGTADAHVTEGNVARALPGLLPCFHHPSIGEIMARGRKLAGSAQWRCEGALLQHGSILVDDDQVQLASLMIAPSPPIPRAATLHESLGRLPDQREVADALFRAVRQLEDASAPDLELNQSLAERTELLRCRYLDPSWTWRR